LYLFVAWSFAIPLVADKQLGFWDAMELSRQVATRHWFQLAFLLILSFLPFIVFAVYADILSLNFMYSMIHGGHFDPNLWMKDPAEFFKQVDNLGRLFAEKYSYLALIQLALLFLVQPFAKGSLMCAYEILFNPRPPPPA